MTLPNGYRLRAADIEVDIPIAAAIQEASDRFDVGFTDNEETWVRDDWHETSHRGAWIAEAADGQAVAYANLSATDPALTFDAYASILPAHRDQLRPALVSHLEQEARLLAVGTPTMILAASSTEAVGPIVEPLGFTFTRAFWHMERSIDPGFRAGHHRRA